MGAYELPESNYSEIYIKDSKSTIEYNYSEDLFAAIRAYNVSKVKVLLDKGCETNIKDIAGWYPLTIAAFWGNEPIVKLLLDHGAGVNLTNDVGWTPLMEACAYGKIDVVKLLLDYGADVGIRSIYGESPFILALSMGHSDIAGLLKLYEERRLRGQL